MNALVDVIILNLQAKFLLQKYAVPTESRPPRFLTPKEAEAAGLLLCTDNKTRNKFYGPTVYPFICIVRLLTLNKNI